MVLTPELVSMVVYGSSVVGALARALLPYLRNRAQAERAGEEPESFQKTYMFTAILAMIVSSIIGILLFPDLIAKAPSDGTAAGVFVYGFIAGWGTTSLFNEILATGQGTGTPAVKKEETTTKPVTPT